MRVPRNPRRVWYWLLLLPFLFTLYPPFYSKPEPSLAGFPFFYWYQLAWVIATALLTWAVYLLARDDA